MKNPTFESLKTEILEIGEKFNLTEEQVIELVGGDKFNNCVLIAQQSHLELLSVIKTALKPEEDLIDEQDDLLAQMQALLGK